MSVLQLASASPRRAALLQQIGVPFQRLTPPAIDERTRAGESPRDYVARMAAEKAQAGQGRVADPDSVVVLGADTTVVFDGRPLGKPDDAAEARAMLRRLSGLEHRVLSAVSLRVGAEYRLWVVETSVHFADLTDELIERYVTTGEPMDKAGAYGIQGFGAVLVAAINGSYSNVVGLPLAETRQLLEWAGIPYWLDHNAS